MISRQGYQAYQLIPRSEVPSASSQKSASKSITNAASHMSATIIKPSTSQKTVKSPSIHSEQDTTIIKPSTPQKKVKSPSIHSEYDANHNTVIIWVDPNIDQSKKTYHDSVTKLQRITPAIYTCANSKQCMNYLDSTNDKNVFLIVSADIGEEIVPKVHDKPQIDSIYIYSQAKRQRLPWANKWSEKVKAILFDMEDIFQQIKFDSGLVGSLTSISIIGRIDLPSLVANELDQSFMYTQLLKEILFEMKHDHTSKTKLVEFCRTKYADNFFELGLIEEFEGKI